MLLLIPSPPGVPTNRRFAFTSDRFTRSLADVCNRFTPGIQNLFVDSI
jgi:hypothetical protein